MKEVRGRSINYWLILGTNLADEVHVQQMIAPSLVVSLSFPFLIGSQSSCEWAPTTAGDICSPEELATCTEERSIQTTHLALVFLGIGPPFTVICKTKSGTVESKIVSLEIAN